MTLAKQILLSVFLLGGATFVLLATVGLLRMPDVYCRMQSATKANTLGILLLALACGLAFGQISVWMRLILTVVFVYMTTPVAAQVLARAAHRTQVDRAPSPGPDPFIEGRIPD